MDFSEQVADLVVACILTTHPSPGAFPQVLKMLHWQCPWGSLSCSGGKSGPGGSRGLRPCLDPSAASHPPPGFGHASARL